MKLLVIIFATLISVLTVQPTVQSFLSSGISEEACCDSRCESDDNCCEHSDNQKDGPEGCCPGGVCNPFQVCAYCCAGIVSRPFLTFVTSSIKINYNQPPQNNPVLGFRSDCYRPPEAA